MRVEKASAYMKRGEVERKRRSLQQDRLDWCGGSDSHMSRRSRFLAVDSSLTGEKIFSYDDQYYIGSFMAYQ